MVTAVADPQVGELEPEDAHLFPDVRVERRFVVQQSGRDFVLYDGLVDALHTLSGGFFDVDVRIEQLPTAENGQTAVCSARVRVFDPERPEVVLRSTSDVGDASPGSVSRAMTPHIIRMASTRAQARALRSLINVGMVAMEELGQGAPEPGQDAAPSAAGQKEPARPSWGQPAPMAGAAEHILIGGKPYTRAEVLAIYAKRVDEATAAGLGMGEVDAVPPERAPLAALVAKSQELKRRLEARASASGT